MALVLTDADRCPMEQFRLRWRWTDTRWNLLPEEDLARIIPLTEGMARKLWRHMGKWFAGNGLDRAQFTVTEMDNQANTTPEVARLWLSERIRDKEEKVWVPFDNLNAVVTDAEIFCRYRDDFCYPDSDMVLWAFSETWALYYFHEEMLYFGQSIDTT